MIGFVFSIVLSPAAAAVACGTDEAEARKPSAIARRVGACILSIAELRKCGRRT